MDVVASCSISLYQASHRVVQAATIRAARTSSRVKPPRLDSIDVSKHQARPMVADDQYDEDDGDFGGDEGFEAVMGMHLSFRP